MWAYLYSQFLHLLVSLLEVTSSAINSGTVWY